MPFPEHWRDWPTLSAWLSSHTTWSRPATFAYLGVLLLVAAGHFAWQHLRSGWREYAGAGAVLRATALSTRRAGPGALLAFRAVVFVTMFYTLLQTSFAEGPLCLRFFTVWNFGALVIFFALGCALSCSCCVDAALMRATPRPSHRLAAAVHHLLLEVQLPMSFMITAVVWLVLYPYDAAIDDSASAIYWKYANLSSLTMHGANFLVMLLEFALDALHIEPAHFGLVRDQPQPVPTLAPRRPQPVPTDNLGTPRTHRPMPARVALRPGAGVVGAVRAVQRPAGLLDQRHRLLLYGLHAGEDARRVLRPHAADVRRVGRGLRAIAAQVEALTRRRLAAQVPHRSLEAYRATHPARRAARHEGNQRGSRDGRRDGSGRARSLARRLGPSRGERRLGFRRRLEAMPCKGRWLGIDRGGPAATGQRRSR